MYRFREILKEKNMTGKELAEKMGITAQAVSGIIREVDSPSVKTLSTIASILNVPVSSLFEDYKTNDNDVFIVCPHCGNKIIIDVKK